MTPVPPKSTAWKVVNWLRDLLFEPLGATDKQVTYVIQPDETYIIGKVQVVLGKPMRLFSEPFKGSDLTGSALPVEVQPVIPTNQRDLEWWLFTP